MTHQPAPWRIDPDEHKVQIEGRFFDRDQMWDVARKLVPGITEEEFEAQWQENVERVARRRLH